MVLLFGCVSSGGGGATPFPVLVTEINFPTGMQYPSDDKPAPTATSNEPAIYDFTYSKVARQGGDLTGVVYFTDPDDYTGVTTLLLQIDQDSGHWEFAVIPVFDPLSGNTTVPFSIPLARNFTPGVFTFYIGLKDTDGNVSNYYHKVLIVKSLQDLSITSLTPYDGTPDAPLNQAIRAAFSQQVFEDEVVIALYQGSTPVSGSSYMTGDGRAITFIPDAFLSPNTSYTATVTLTVNGSQLTNSFSTAAVTPLTTPSDMVGKTFSIALTADNLIEPEEGKAIFDSIPILPTILMKPLSFSGTSFQALSAGGEDDGAGGYKQSALIPVMGPDTNDFVDPYFRAGPTVITIDLAAFGLSGSISVYDTVVSGKFVENGGAIVGFDSGAFSAYLDSAEANAIVSEVAMSDVDVCEILPLCDKNGLIRIRAENMAGNWETAIAYLYDISCSANPLSISAASGGAITVTCVDLRDGAGFQGADIVFYAQTGVVPGSTDVGAWDTTGYTCVGNPPSCQVPDASGTISVTVTIAPGELTPGDASFRVGGKANLPPGIMSRAVSITVQ